MQMTLYTFSRFAEALAGFSALYPPEFEYFAFCPAESMIKTLKPYRERVCRFCGRGATDTKFKKRAHAIPELLGNKYLLSDSECDQCNELFSLLENDLANFLGATRSVSQVSTKKKSLGFTAHKKHLTIKKEPFYGIEGIAIARDGVNNKVFAYDLEQGRFDITFTKQPYTPLKVYKALLKIAMSVMPPEHVGDYGHLLPLLVHDENNVLAQFAVIGMFESPWHTTTPRYHISQKANPDNAVCTHVVTLYFLQFIFSISIPLHNQDIAIGLYKGEDYQLYMCPPLYTDEPIEDDKNKCLFEWKNLTSTEPIIEEQVMALQMAPDAFKNTELYDPATGIFSPSTEARPNIVKIVMTQGDELPDFPEGPFTHESENSAESARSSEG